jgi:hypothetical protein
MKAFGFLLLLSGWGIVLATVGLLTEGTARTAFLLSGIGVEMIGLVLVAHSHLILRGARQ